MTFCDTPAAAASRDMLAMKPPKSPPHWAAPARRGEEQHDEQHGERHSGHGKNPYFPLATSTKRFQTKGTVAFTHQRGCAAEMRRAAASRGDEANKPKQVAPEPDMRARPQPASLRSAASTRAITG